MLEEPDAERRLVLVGAIEKMSVGWATDGQQGLTVSVRAEGTLPLSTVWRVRYCFDCVRDQRTGSL